MSFKITKKESDNKTVRFPIPLIEQIEKTIAKKEISFSRFVILACEYALANMNDKEK